VILASVPPLIHEALELVGFTNYFHISDSVASASEFANRPLNSSDCPLLLPRMSNE
jgi:hypothetical protein